MKKILLLVSLSSLLFSFDAYQRNSNSSTCFYNLVVNGDTVTSTYINNGGSTKTLVADISWYEAETTPAYYYNGVCNSTPSNFDNNETFSDHTRLGLEETQYHFLMGLTANLLGFTLVFLVGFLFILQGRR